MLSKSINELIRSKINEVNTLTTVAIGSSVVQTILLPTLTTRCVIRLTTA